MCGKSRIDLTRYLSCLLSFDDSHRSPVLDAAGPDGVLGNVTDLAFKTAGPGYNFPHRRSVDAVLRGSGLNSLLRIAIAAGEVGLKRVRDCVDVCHGKPSLLGNLAGPVSLMKADTRGTISSRNREPLNTP